MACPGLFPAAEIALPRNEKLAPQHNTRQAATKTAGVASYSPPAKPVDEPQPWQFGRA